MFIEMNWIKHVLSTLWFLVISVILTLSQKFFKVIKCLILKKNYNTIQNNDKESKRCSYKI